MLKVTNNTVFRSLLLHKCTIKSVFLLGTECQPTMAALHIILNGHVLQQASSFGEADRGCQIWSLLKPHVSFLMGRLVTPEVLRMTATAVSFFIIAIYLMKNMNNIHLQCRFM